MDRLKTLLVLASTIGLILINYIADKGQPGVVMSDLVLEKYSTYLTPAAYTFSIWLWIFFGLTIFAILQLLHKNNPNFRGIRSLYLGVCALNSVWIFCLRYEHVPLSFFAIAALFFNLLWLNLRLPRKNNLFARIIFGLYFGWITILLLANSLVLLNFSGFQPSDQSLIWLSSALIWIVAGIGIYFRHSLPNVAYPVSIAFAITGIAVKQSGKTPIVVVSAIAVVVLLISALSFIMSDPPKTERTTIKPL